MIVTVQVTQYNDFQIPKRLVRYRETLCCELPETGVKRIPKYLRSNPSYNDGHRLTVRNGQNQKKKHHRSKRRYGFNFADFVSKAS